MLNAVKKLHKKLCKKGFTLLELLVVVLIIGILAAIALPQYQLAVDKTQFTKLQAAAKEIADAYARYHLTTNNYPNDIKQLDIDFSEGNEITYPTNNASCIVFTDYYCCLVSPRPSSSYGDTMCGNLDYSFYHVRRLFSDDYSLNSYKDCRAKTNNKRAKKICSYFGRTRLAEDAAILTPYGREDGYSTYIINGKNL